MNSTHAVIYECGEPHYHAAEFIIAAQIDYEWSGWTGDFLPVLTAYLRNTATAEQPGNLDLEKVQRGAWGKLGYTPKQQ